MIENCQSFIAYLTVEGLYIFLVICSTNMGRRKDISNATKLYITEPASHTHMLQLVCAPGPIFTYFETLVQFNIEIQWPQWATIFIGVHFAIFAQQF